MNKLSREDLMSLEKYAQERAGFRGQVMAHKKNRRVALGPNATLYFEDRLTMQYQIQEILRIEKVFEAEGIEEELEAYNPLIPDGSNWKATFMIEFEKEEERRAALAKMIGIEKVIWVQVGDCEKVNPIANEDLERETDDKTSAVHFLRFELSGEMVELAKNGAPIRMGVDHENYRHETGELGANIAQSLSEDLALRH
ncbi:MAG: DUF3501 family protein [Acidiferrobacterales bacterium]|nr:DUF3501 family protein [Acidiferrobacterales bacterium]